MSRPTAAFSATLEVELAHEPGTLGRLCTAIGDVGGNIRSLRGFTATGGSLREEVVVDAASETHVEDICAAVNGLEGIKVINAVDRTFKIHEGGTVCSTEPFRLQPGLNCRIRKCTIPFI